ncbi:class I SAM-dependent methyltransferase [Phytohabitans sp. ZYX-F-186]|uniref:Class I SAM-dependent methyltransferase n=1 Tax=Phytohabitans maris TaxID=3071409 RepID=A0ABU0ZC95_9ACTN|nr:class I SAM-dependent methyltransferase [Phytohabitans sp. ZYX-F-186]MDQ7904695.1 class I SAM-dependent methyltransferase [Phytohabitans sp. ZYX-F-186]
MSGRTAASELDGRCTTRPGTPMIGPYSVNQMDDFYTAIARGEVKASGIMNLAQRLYIAERCPERARVVDVCCGRGLQLPTLYRYGKQLQGYVGLDLSPANLAEAAATVERLNASYGAARFPTAFVECDVAAPWPAEAVAGEFDVAVYTSALEHLPREQAVASLRHTAAALRPGAVLYLSTPNTPGDPPRPLQHRVHVYEWNTAELEPVLAECGLVVTDRVGLLCPPVEQVAAALTAQYGDGACAWYQHLRQSVPAALLDAVVAAVIPQAATEVLYVCRRPA